jgi:outer membrane lipoprotein-sorting protein
MIRKSFVILLICISLALTISLAAAGDIPASRVNLSAAAIVDKNVVARGGLQAWRGVQTMSMEGKLGAGGNQRAALPVPVPGRNANQTILPQRPVQEVQLPFAMELKRPRKMRIELTFNGQTAVQVFDGSNGWKLRPFLNRRVVEPYTADEMQSESIQSDLDGPLVDYAAKGTKIELAGMEKVEDRDTYKLKLTLKSGQSIHVWIDAQTFLEAKIEGQPRRLDGIYHPVEVYYRDYRQVQGLQIPHVLETKVLPVALKSARLKDPAVPPEKITIDKVVLNRNLEDSRFSKPEAGVASKAN